MVSLLQSLAKWEPLWLFAILSLELAVGLYSAYILTIEYFYDRNFNEKIRTARKDRRRKQYDFENLTQGESK